MRWMLIHAFVVLAHLLTSTFADVTCPRIPEKCTCKVSKNLVLLECDGVDVRSIAQSIGTNQIDELHIANGKDVKIEALPFTGLRTIAIVNSTLESFATTGTSIVDKSLTMSYKLKSGYDSLPQVVEMALSTTNQHATDLKNALVGAQSYYSTNNHQAAEVVRDDALAAAMVSAKLAVKTLEGILEPDDVQENHFVRGTERGYPVHIGNIPFQMTENEVKTLGRTVGAVKSVRMGIDRETGRPRGFAFIEFEDEGSINSAIQMLNGQVVRGRTIRVTEAYQSI